MKSRVSVISALLVLLSAALFLVYATVYTITGQQPVTLPFYPGSIFTTQIPAGASAKCWNPSGSPQTCSASSADIAIVNNIFASSDAAGGYAASNISAQNITSSSVNGFYYGSATDPIYRVNSGSSPCPPLTVNCAAGKYFHLPKGAQWDSVAGDSNIIIWDQSSDIDATAGGRILSSYFFDSGCPGGWPSAGCSTVTHGTLISLPNTCTATTTAQADAQAACQLPMYYNAVNFPFTDTSALGNGISSAGFAGGAGYARELEIQSNAINHALQLGVNCLMSTGGTVNAPVFPATGNAIGCSGTNTLSPLEGSMFWIDSGYNCAALPAWQAPFCTAMQKYAGYIDVTGGAGYQTGLYVQPIEGGVAHTAANTNDAMFNEPNPTGTPAWIITNGGVGSCTGGFPRTCVGSNGLTVIEDSATTAEKIVWYAFQMPGLITGHHLHILDPCVAKSMAGVSGGCIAGAVTVYVSQAGGSVSCGADGTQATTALASVTWTAGNTYKLCGTFTSAISVSASGTSGTPITIYGESGALLTSAAWNTTAFSSGGNNYIVLNGGNNLTIQNTNNGTSGAFGNSLASIGIDFSGSSNSTIENLTVRNIYIRTPNSTTDNSAGATGSRCIQWILGSNDTVSNVITHDCRLNSYFAGSSDSNFTISGNTGYNQAAHWWIAPYNTGSTMTNVTYSGNVFHDPAPVWDSSPADFFHIDGVHYFCQSSSTCSGFYAYNNYFYGSFGIDYTAQIFSETNSGTNASQQVYNNLIVNTTTHQSSNGAIDVQMGASGLLANNTVVGSGSANGGVGIQIISGTSLTQENNTVQGFNYMEAVSSPVTFSAINYNSYYNWSNGWQYYGSGKSTLAAWGTAVSGEGNSIQTNPNLSAGYIPNGGSPLINAGTNLTSLGISTLNSDFVGNGRPMSGAWDIGAYQATAIPGNSGPAPSVFIISLLRTLEAVAP